MPDDLAAVVEKPHAERAIAALRDEGVYDDSRQVTAHADAIAIPVTAEPTETAVATVIERGGPPRATDLDALLDARGWTTAERDRAPASWAVVGDVLLVRVPEDCPRPAELADALLELHGGCETVLERQGIDGAHREPAGRVLAGDEDTETVHREHGIEYALDPQRVMFSPGNKAERQRMGAAVDADEQVLDMFAGIGYFTLPIAAAGATVLAVERNPGAFDYLRENVRRNGLTERVATYRADCRDVPASVDRVVMGHYDAHEYLDSALAALEPGGRLHLHAATPNRLVPERPFERLEDAATRADRRVTERACRTVKTYSEGVSHVVVDATVEKA
jgi:tRNA wybutosine-synthesizing protein 2